VPDASNTPAVPESSVADAPEVPDASAYEPQTPSYESPEPVFEPKQQETPEVPDVPAYEQQATPNPIGTPVYGQQPGKPAVSATPAYTQTPQGAKQELNGRAPQDSFAQRAPLDPAAIPDPDATQTFQRIPDVSASGFAAVNMPEDAQQQRSKEPGNVKSETGRFRKHHHDDEDMPVIQRGKASDGATELNFASEPVFTNVYNANAARAAANQQTGTEQPGAGYYGYSSNTQ
jgi:hypothetical protein